MKIKNNLIFNFFVYAFIDVFLYSVLMLFNIIGVIKVDDYIVNVCIYTFSSVICLGYYIFIYKKYLSNNNLKEKRLKECIAMLLTTIIVSGPQIIIGLMMPGVHLAVCATWIGGLLSIFINYIIIFFKSKNDLMQSYNKEVSIFAFVLKIWISIVFLAMFIFGLAIVFFAENFAVL